MAETTNQVVEALRTSKDISAELSGLLKKKESVEQSLATLEQQIFALEGSYLQDTCNLGNILTGWENYLSARSGALKRSLKFREADRMFSLSSSTALRHNADKLRDEEGRPIFIEDPYAAAPHDDSEEEKVSNNNSNSSSNGPKSQQKGTPKKSANRPKKQKVSGAGGGNANGYDSEEYLEV